MKLKKIGWLIALITVIVAFAIICGVMGGFFLKHIFDAFDKQAAAKQASKNEFLAPFHEVYDVLREKYPSIKSLREDLGAGDHYGMYYIECDIDENTDCFAEFVDIQCEIKSLMEARKEDEWFKEFDGHIVIGADSRKLRAFYHHGSISREFWADDIISDDYGALWDAFPEKDDIYLAIELTDYSDEIKSEILQKNKGRNITVEPQLGSESDTIS